MFTILYIYITWSNVHNTIYYSVYEHYFKLYRHFLSNVQNCYYLKSIELDVPISLNYSMSMFVLRILIQSTVFCRIRN